MRELTLDDIEDHTKDWLIHVVEQKERIEELEKAHRELMSLYHGAHYWPAMTKEIGPVDECSMEACIAAVALLKPDCKTCADQGQYMVMRPGMFVPCQDCNAEVAEAYRRRALTTRVRPPLTDHLGRSHPADQDQTP